MAKVVQLRDKDGPIFPTTVFKKVRGLALKHGQTINDPVMKMASQIVIYYSINANLYFKSMIIPNGVTQWFWDLNSADGFVIYFAITNWENGTLSVSAYSTQNSNICILGYDLVR